MNNTRALKDGTILNGKYMIDSVIGEGGFGITYKATDLTLEEIVAIKEYFPSSLATRDTISGKTDEITVITGDSETAFKRGVKKFEDEAARLAKFQKEPGIVSVKTFFHENNTGYMVMEYIDGITLKEYLENHGGKVSPDEAKKIMGRVFTSLSNVHKAGIVHRDISPDNIMITPDGQGKLIDFGAARFVGNEDEKSLTVILKEGYAPPEQYHRDGKQGPWTDIYAICATIYRMVSGNRPQEASGRMLSGDEIVPLSKCAGADPVFSRTIEKGMSIEAEKRYQTVEKLISAFDGKKIPVKYYVIAGGALAAILLVGLIVLVINLTRAKKDNTNGGAINTKQAEETADEIYKSGETTEDGETGQNPEQKDEPRISDEENLSNLIEKAEELFGQDYADLTYEYEDFDGDGIGELICEMTTDPIEYEEGSQFRAYAICEGFYIDTDWYALLYDSEQLYMWSEANGYEGCSGTTYKIFNMGKTKMISLVYCTWSGTVSVNQIYEIKTDELKSVEFQEGIPDNFQSEMSIDSNGVYIDFTFGVYFDPYTKHYYLDFGDVSSMGSARVKLWYIDGEFVECSSVVIDEDRLTDYDGVEDIFANIEGFVKESNAYKNILQYRDFKWEDYSIDSILLCSDDHIYINYVTPRNSYLSFVIELTINNGQASYDEVSVGYRLPHMTKFKHYYPNLTSSKDIELRNAYEEFFYSLYSDNDIVCFADVTHDGKDEMLVVHLEEYYGYGYVYTFNESEIVELYSNGRGLDHAGGFYNWYLVRRGDNWNLVENSHGMWQGYGSLGTREYYLSDSGEVQYVYSVTYEYEDGQVVNETWDYNTDGLEVDNAEWYCIIDSSTDYVENRLNTNPLFVFAME